MVADSYTVTTHQSWFDRLRASFGGMCAGLIFIVASFPLLVWNEGRAIRRYRTLEEGRKIVVPVADPSAIDASYEGRLIHFYGTAVPRSDVSDATFGVTPSARGVDAIKLRRAVEMYQWMEESRSETHKTKGGGSETTKTYTYTKGWTSREVESSSFDQPYGHENPSRFPFLSTDFVADPVTVGAFTLPEDMVGMISWFDPLGYPISLDSIPDESIRSKSTSYGQGYFLSYGGGVPSYPAVGDVRVTFDAVKSGPVSILARQTGSTLSRYAIKSGEGNIFILERGAMSPEEMFQRAQAQNRMTSWLLRLLGFFFMFCGFAAIAEPLSVVADVIPCIGPMVGDLVSCGTGLAAFLLSLVLSSLVIAVAWIAYRPLWAVSILAGSGALAFFLRKKSKRDEQIKGYIDPNTDIMPVAAKVGEGEPVVAQPVGTSYDDDVIVMPVPRKAYSLSKSNFQVD